MAISVDTVYQRVLALANKEQRGYITPQEFNLLANQAQMSIFESYFYSKNIRKTKEVDGYSPTDEADIVELLDVKLGPFKSVASITSGVIPTEVTISGTTYDIFQVGRIFLNDMECQKVDINEIQRYKQSKRHAAAFFNTGPLYTDDLANGKDVLIYASPATYSGSDVVTFAAVDAATIECFRVPKKVEWAYVVVGNNKKALYNANAAVNFELHRAEEDTLVVKILELAGIVMNKPGLVQIGNQKDSTELQLQNT